MPETLERAQTEIPAWERKPIAFLDRDGVLNRDSIHVFRIPDFEWMPGAFEAVRLLNDSGYHVVIATNQGGIAKGFYTEDDFFALTEWMKRELWAARSPCRRGLPLSVPCRWNGRTYRRESEDRKPNPGMLLRAMRDLPNDVTRSFFVGDQPSDRKARNPREFPFRFPGRKSVSLHPRGADVLA